MKAKHWRWLLYGWCAFLVIASVAGGVWLYLGMPAILPTPRPVRFDSFGTGFAVGLGIGLFVLVIYAGRER